MFPEGLSAVERHLRAAGRPLQALCGLELRNGRQANMQEFMTFNERYIETLRKAGMLVTDRMPVTRSNLVVTGAEAVHRIHAFTYTVPASSPSSRAPTFVIAGIPEVLFGPIEISRQERRLPERPSTKTVRTRDDCGSPHHYGRRVARRDRNPLYTVRDPIRSSRVSCSRGSEMPHSGGFNGTTSCCRSRRYVEIDVRQYRGTYDRRLSDADDRGRRTGAIAVSEPRRVLAATQHPAR